MFQWPLSLIFSKQGWKYLCLLQVHEKNLKLQVLEFSPQTCHIARQLVSLSVHHGVCYHTVLCMNHWGSGVWETLCGCSIDQFDGFGCSFRAYSWKSPACSGVSTCSCVWESLTYNWSFSLAALFLLRAVDIFTHSWSLFFTMGRCVELVP